MRHESEAEFLPWSITEALKTYCAMDSVSQYRGRSGKSPETYSDKVG